MTVPLKGLKNVKDDFRNFNVNIRWFITNQTFREKDLVLLYFDT